MPTFDPALTYLVDGAMATELERRGADLSGPLWSARVLATNPTLIEAVHLDYYRAGADIAISASYQATPQGLAALGLDRAAAVQLMQRSVGLARRARERYLSTPGEQPVDRRLLVAASIGPFGAQRHDGSEYHGRYGVNARQLVEHHRRQVDALAPAGADLLAFETIPSLGEGEAIVRAMEEFRELDFWLSFSCADDRHVRHGEDFARCAALASESPRLRAIGVNCTSPEHVLPLLQSARGSTARALLAYPNSGERWDATRRHWAPPPGPARRWLDDARAWQRAGARLIGGCCRTTPADIRSLRQELAHQIV